MLLLAFSYLCFLLCEPYVVRFAPVDEAFLSHEEEEEKRGAYKIEIGFFDS